MSDHRGVEQPSAAPPLPGSIWVVAWSSLAGQVVLLLRQGIRSDNEVSLFGSVVLGALIVGFVSVGVVRARPIRVALAWILLALSTVGWFVALLLADDVEQATIAVLSLATAGTSFAGLLTFRQTAWYAWQRTRPPAREGASIGGLIAIGILVGVLGGIIGSADDGVDVDVRVADR
ncbi:hypothetical protein [Nocardioides stalactiti]|uniref:hypothetical protein n=1 Tax=Nocardioides stalactiti TaxID=2755356 RepID=UPI0015FED0E5|nr:hypothetical protein [Nocardioides stalactiti]